MSFAPLAATPPLLRAQNLSSLTLMSELDATWSPIENDIYSSVQWQVIPASPQGPSWLRSIARTVSPVVRISGGIALAPFKLMLTPVVGALVGGVYGAVSGFVIAGVAPVLMAAVLLDPNSTVSGSRTKKGPAQQFCENIVTNGVAVPVVLGTMVVASTTGLILCGTGGALAGAAAGVAEGYQSSWDNTIPNFARFMPAGNNPSESLYERTMKFTVSAMPAMPCS